MSPPFVSVILTSLNQASGIEAAVRSVLDQSYPQLELIAVDMGSTDASVAVLQRLQGQDARLQWFSLPGTGPVAALNRALRLVRGTVVGWIDTACRYTPGAVMRVVQALADHPQWLLVRGRAQHVNSQVLAAPTLAIPLEAAPADDVSLCAATVFFRRTAWVMLGPLNERVGAGFADEYWHRAAHQLPGRIGRLPEVQAWCHTGPAGIVSAHVPDTGLPVPGLLPDGKPAWAQPWAHQRFAQAISLGSFCHAAAVLRKLGWRAGAGPFDWLFSTPEVTAHVLTDDFSLFLDPAQYQPVPTSEKLDPSANQCDHRFYRDRFGLRFMFNHHLPNQERDQAYFRRCVARFKAAMAANQPVLWVMVSQTPSFDAARYAGILNVLQARQPHSLLLILQFAVRPAAQGDGQVTVLSQAPGFLALQLWVSALSNGVVFDNPQDAQLLQRVLQHFSVQAHPHPNEWPEHRDAGQFDEIWYLQNHPDVAHAVATGSFNTGWMHFERHGLAENRAARWHKPAAA